MSRLRRTREDSRTSARADPDGLKLEKSRKSEDEQTGASIVNTLALKIIAWKPSCSMYLCRPAPHATPPKEPESRAPVSSPPTGREVPKPSMR